jgi:Zn-finger nucleic acid-binding protein
MRCAKCGTAIDEHVFPGATVNCPRCGAPFLMATGAAGTGDPYRERMPDRAPSALSPSPRDLAPVCPRCMRALEEAHGSDLACGTCRGTFVQHADLAARIDSERPSQAPSVLPRHAASRPPEPAVRYGRCPRCSELMTRTNFGRHSGIVVDACRDHGTWFDRGELDAALDFVRAGGLEEDFDTRSDLAPDPDDEATIRAVEAELSAEAMREKRSIERAARIADDFLGLLFGFSTRSVRRSDY